MKSNVIREEERRRWVAPHWGAWIEISQSLTRCAGMSCRTPLGCVD